MLKGLFTALVTPFSSDGSIDYSSLSALIEAQIAAAVDGIVLLGTTGESPCISHTERQTLLATVAQQIDGRCQFIVGTGSNNTAQAIAYSQAAEQAGADALLVVNPYYNKPTQKGLYLHFTAIADSVNIPIILYNIAGRTAVNVATNTLLELAKHPRIVAVKEASGDMQQIQEVIAAAPADFSILSGDDAITCQLMQAGGHGVVSVLSNLLPQQMKNMVDAALQQKWEQALEIEQALLPLFDAAFIETNPQPIKTLLAAEQQCQEVFRLPLTTMEPDNKAKLLAVWQQFKEASVEI